MDHDLIALVDLDGTLADYSGALRQSLSRICHPTERDFLSRVDNFHKLEEYDYWKSRMDLIKSQPGWWRDLPRLEENFKIVDLFRELGFKVHVLTKGPWSKSQAWAEKVEWCREHLPDAEVHITGSPTGKGMVYGKVLFDDFPAYVESWLKWRPRGVAILPHHHINSEFNPPNSIRWDGSDSALSDIRKRLEDLT